MQRNIAKLVMNQKEMQKRRNNGKELPEMQKENVEELQADK